MRSRLLSNTAANGMLQVLSPAIQIVLVPIFLAYIGPEQYGLYVLALTFNGYFSFLGFGVPGALNKFVAELTAKGDTERRARMINVSLIYHLCVGIVVGSATALIALWFVPLLRVSSSTQSIAQTALLVAAFFAPAQWLLIVFDSVLVGLQSYWQRNIAMMLQLLVSAVAGVWVVSHGGGAVGLILVTLSARVLAGLINCTLVVRMIGYRPSLLAWDRASMRRLFKFSSAMFAQDFAGLLIYQTDVLVIGAFLPVAAITLYHLASRFYEVVRSAGWLVNSAVLPAAAYAEASVDQSFLRDLMYLGPKYNVALVVPLVVLLMVFAPDIVRFWVGDAYANEVSLIARAFIFYRIINAPLSIYGPILTGMGRMRAVVTFALAVAVCNLVLSLILVRVWGVLGVVLGTSIPNFIFAPIAFFKFTRELGIDRQALIREAFLTTYPWIALVGAAAFFWRMVYQPQSLLQLVLCLLVSYGLCVVMFVSFGLSGGERSDWWRVGQRAFRWTARSA